MKFSIAHIHYLIELEERGKLDLLKRESKSKYAQEVLSKNNKRARNRKLNNEMNGQKYKKPLPLHSLYQEVEE